LTARRRERGAAETAPIDQSTRDRLRALGYATD